MISLLSKQTLEQDIQLALTIGGLVSVERIVQHRRYNWMIVELIQTCIDDDGNYIGEPTSDTYRFDGISFSTDLVEMLAMSNTLSSMMERTVIQLSKEDKMIRVNPVIGTVLPDDDQKEAVPLNKEEYESLMVKLTRPLRVTAKGLIDQNDLIRQAIRDAVLLILKTGVRRQECVDLEWTDWNSSWLHVRGTKTDDADRMIPITDPDVLGMLERRQGYGGKYIFSTRHGTPLHATALLKYMKRETGHTVHELRHTFITNAARAGVRAEVLMTITGHKDLETLLQVYTHVNEQDKLDAVEKLSSYCKPTANPEPNQTTD